MPFTELVIPIFALIFAMAFAVLWFRDRSRRYVLGVSTSYAALFAAWMVDIVLYDDQSALVSAIVHVLSALSVAAVGWSLCARSGGRTPIAGMALVIAISTPLLYIAAERGNLEAVVAVGSATTTLLFMIGGVAWWATKPTLPLEKLLLLLIGALITIGFFNPVYRLLVVNEDAALISEGSLYVTINFVAMAIIPVVFAVTVLGLLTMDEWQRLKELARCDPLSGLLSRSAFEAEIAAMLARGRQDDIPISLIVSDIDHFKSINDNHGHTVGDRVITHFGAVVKDRIRSTDIAGRVGGEEFCVAVWNCREAPAARLAERIRQSIERGSPRRERDLPVFTSSFGVAQAHHAEAYAALFERADAALYEAKNTGRNRVAKASDADGKGFAAKAIVDPNDTGEATPNVANFEEYRARS